MFVQMMKLQKQLRGLNTCAFFCAAYMTDTVLGIDVSNAVYEDGQIQRNWFKDCLFNAALISCPRVIERPSRFLQINPPLSEFN